MSGQKISLRQAFDEDFGKEDKYFGEWFIRSDESLTIFLENNLISKEKFFKQLRYLYLYLESLEILKRQAVSSGVGIASAISKEVWYCCILLLLVGLIDQHTKNELKQDGKIKSQKDRFLIVMNSLTDLEKSYMFNYYNGSSYKTFDQIISHLYETRTFFAHEIILPDGAIPQDGSLGSSNKKPGTWFPNMPHGRIFLSIVVALIRYFGFSGKMDIASTKDFKSLSDLFRQA